MDSVTYFVTWRLADSQRLLNSDDRTVVAMAIEHFAGQRYEILVYVVMDDHVHVLVRPYEGISLEKVVHSWKSFTAHRLQKEFGRTGAVWQDEFFDRIVRDDEELVEKANYILGNPLKRWPDLREYRWIGFGQ